MFGLEESQLWPAAIGCIVLGSMMIGVALYIAMFFVDWAAIKARRANRAKLAGTPRDAEQGG